MKNPLAVGLAHIMGPHKADERPAAGAFIANMNMNMNMNIPPTPPSPYPGRRAPLSAKVEADLRAACIGVLVNTKPSHTYVADDSSRAFKPQLDYEAIKRSASTRAPDDSRPRVPRNRSDPEEATPSAKYAYRPDAPVDQLFLPGDAPTDLLHTNMLRRKDDKTPVPPAPWSDADAVNPDARSRPAQRSFSAETNGSTPKTDVTESLLDTSTAPTSAGITPARASKRASSHIYVEPEQPPKTNATAIEWMRHELERRRNKQPVVEEPSAPPPPPPQQQLSRAPSRARSIRDNIVDYIRPGTSRSASRDASRPSSRAAIRRPLRSPSSDHHDSDAPSGWRNWSLSRKASRSDLSRSDSSRGRTKNRKDSNTDIDLNRELPPLPGLDQWKLPTPPNMDNEAVPNWVPIKATKSVDSVLSGKDETIAVRLGSPVRQKPDVYLPSRSFLARSGPSMPTLNLGSYINHDDVASALKAKYENVVHRSKSATRAKARQYARPVETSAPDTGSKRNLHDDSRLPRREAAALPPTSTGFSKHRNYDSASIPPALGNPRIAHTRPKQQKYRHVMEIPASQTPPPVPPKDGKWWNLRSRSKKPMTWQDQIEKMGIRDGLLVNDEACGSPIIRY